MSGDINLNSIMQSGKINSTRQTGSAQGTEKKPDEPLSFPHTTTTKVIQNKDGTFSEIYSSKCGVAHSERETKYTFDKDGNKIIISVRQLEQPSFGKPKEKEYLDTDGDGFADQVVERFMGEEKVTKLPPIKDVAGEDRENRKMWILAKGMVCG